MTGRDLVSASLRLIGALAPGETLEAQEATDGLAALNRMIGSWSTESLLIFARVRESFAITASVQSYTMGVGGDFNTSRPQKIDEAYLSVAGSTTVEYPVRILSLSEWASIGVKSISSEIVTDLYAEGTYPLETINLYPNPSVANSLVLWSWKPLTSVTTLDTVISLPPGYEEALIYNLAIRLSPEYGRPVVAEVASIATDSKAAIKRMNHKPSYLRVDDVPADHGSGFNILTGDYR